MKILIYTFRSYPNIDLLKSMYENVFVLGRLKEDLAKLTHLLAKSNYDVIIGLSRAKKHSTFETKAVNIFNNGKVDKNGKDSYEMDYPKNGYGEIKIRSGYTTSFCNYAMYNISKINKKQTIHSFVHVKEEDIKKLMEYIGSLRQAQF